MSAGLSGVLGAITGAAVSYVLSRWAWERKGRPHLLKETVPFWLVSLGAWFVLGATSHYASVWAVSMDKSHWQRVVIVDGAYLLANCLTFLTRFAIFHYFLFADRGSKLSDSVVSVAEAAKGRGSPFVAVATIRLGRTARPAALPLGTSADVY